MDTKQLNKTMIIVPQFALGCNDIPMDKKKNYNPMDELYKHEYTEEFV